MICLLESAGVKCVSSHPGFEAVCLSAWVLEPAQVLRRNQLEARSVGKAIMNSFSLCCES